jgi:hypothetical protein
MDSTPSDEDLEHEETPPELEVVADPPAVVDFPESAPAIPQRTTIAGVIVDSVGSIDPERVEKVTSGRRKIPLSMMFRPGGTDGASAAGLDHYVSAVCYDVINDTAKVSSMIFTGSTEAVLSFADPTEIPGGLSLGNLKGCCLLILNPVVTGAVNLRVPSLRACLKLGRLSGLSTCSHSDCSKPVLTDRDGSLCYQHAVSAGVRVNTGGTSVTFEPVLSAEDEAKRKREKQAHAPSAEEKKAKEIEQRRQELLAKKKTALMLLNRGSGGSRLEAQARLSTGSLGESTIDIGELTNRVDKSDETRLARLEALKRKRETLEKKNAAVQRKAEQEQMVKELENKRPEMNREPQPVSHRKSLSQQLADQIKVERGF